MSAAACPIVDPKSLGAFVGLSTRATSGDLLRAMKIRTHVTTGNIDKLNEILLKAMEGESDLRGRLKRVIDVYVDFLQHNVNFSRIVQRESGAGRHMDKIFDRLSPLFQAGMVTTQATYPAARRGEMSAEQLLISFYGMIVSYFNFGSLLGRLMNTDLFSMENVETRKKHLHRMLDVVVDELERQEQPEPK
jgi:hypothetical protein